MTRTFKSRASRSASLGGSGLTSRAIATFSQIGASTWCLLDDPDCIDLMARFIRARPELWNEDIAEEG